MRHYPLLLMAMTLLYLVALLVVNDQFNQGMQRGNASREQGASTIQGFKPAGMVPGHIDSPAESSYCGGVTPSGMDMTLPGSTVLGTSGAGKTITESTLNTPPDDKPSLDAPFTSEGLAVEDKAETITGDGLDGRVDQPASSTGITIHQRLRGTRIEQYCTHTTAATEDWENTEVYRYVTVSPGQFRYSQSGKQLVFSAAFPVTGVVMNAQLRAYSSFYFLNSRCTFINSVSDVGTVPGAIDTFTLSSAPGPNITKGQALTDFGYTADGNCINGDSGDWQIYRSLTSGKSAFMLTMHVRVNEKERAPRAKWSENYLFSKTEGAMADSQYVGPEETQIVVVSGKTHSIHQGYQKWQGTYLTRIKTEGTCGEFVEDPTCTMTHSEYADTVNGFCIGQQAIYSCERKGKGNGQICNGGFFCRDGSCTQVQTRTNSMFGQAISALAAVAIAGEDVTALSGVNVRALTGETQHCKKMAVGLNNCCEDSGWGQDVGLPGCSSEEKALGKAKDKKPMVYVGEHCNKRALDVCLKKKRGYCVFNSKLVRIIQE